MLSLHQVLFLYQLLKTAHNLTAPPVPNLKALDTKNNCPKHSLLYENNNQLNKQQRGKRKYAGWLVIHITQKETRRLQETKRRHSPSLGISFCLMNKHTNIAVLQPLLTLFPSHLNYAIKALVIGWLHLFTSICIFFVSWLYIQRIPHS